MSSSAANDTNRSAPCTSLRWSIWYDDEAQRCQRKNNRFRFLLSHFWPMYLDMLYNNFPGFHTPICKMLIIFPNSSNCSKHGVSCFIRGTYTCYFFSNNVNICKIIIMLGDGSYWQNQVFSLPILFGHWFGWPMKFASVVLGNLVQQSG